MEGVRTMKYKRLMPMKLQFFAENEGGTETPDNETPEINVEELSDEQLAAIKEKYGFKDDEDVNSIVQSKRTRWQKELEKEKDEAARLAKLSEKERQQALLDKEKEDFEKERAQFKQEKLFVEKGKQLTAEGLPSEFAHRIVGETAEDILADVKKLREEFDKAVEAKVNERLATKRTTRVGTGAGQMTKAEIMSVKDSAERQRLIAENRDLF
ncbi:hypothetical protein D920_01737 [Enterococcus faecalis 13-SD-W-01]|nr:hypothetical protein D920_01737 [Enterococcus faecalis 13-SD-W-01]